MRPWVMPGHGGGGESTNRLRAESTESTESFQPHFMGEEQIRRKTVTEITLLLEPKRSKLSVLSVHSAAPPDAQRAQLARTEPALAQAQASFVSASNGGKAATSRLTTLRRHVPLAAARPSRPHEGDGGFCPTSSFGFFNRTGRHTQNFLPNGTK